MKLQHFLNKIDFFFAHKDDNISFMELISKYKVLLKLRYNKELIKDTIKTAKLLNKKAYVAKKLINEFPKYIDLKFNICRFQDSYNKDGNFVFLKEQGVIVFEIFYETLNEIKNILIEKGYTDEQGFLKTLTKNPLDLLILFINEVKEESHKKWDTLNKTLSKKEIEKIQKIFKEKKEVNRQKRKKKNAKINIDSSEFKIDTDVFENIEESKKYIERFANELIDKIEKNIQQKGIKNV